MDPLSTLQKGLSTVENVGEKLAQPVETLAGGALKAGEAISDGTSNTILLGEKAALEPFQVVTGGATGLLGALEGKLSELIKSKSPFTDISKLIGAGADSTSDIGGSSVEAVLLQLAAKERDRLADKVNQLKNLKAPGPDSTPQEQSDFDTTKANLMADIQAIENSIQQVTTIATNDLKQEGDDNMAIARNIGG